MHESSWKQVGIAVAVTAFEPEMAILKARIVCEEKNGEITQLRSFRDKWTRILFPFVCFVKLIIEYRKLNTIESRLGHTETNRSINIPVQIRLPVMLDPMDSLTRDISPSLPYQLFVDKFKRLFDHLATIINQRPTNIMTSMIES